MADPSGIGVGVVGGFLAGYGVHAIRYVAQRRARTRKLQVIEEAFFRVLQQGNLTCRELCEADDADERIDDYLYTHIELEVWDVARAEFMSIVRDAKRIVAVVSAFEGLREMKRLLESLELERSRLRSSSIDADFALQSLNEAIFLRATVTLDQTGQVIRDYCRHDVGRAYLNSWTYDKAKDTVIREIVDVTPAHRGSWEPMPEAQGG